MKLACVIHRFGADIAGGSEAHCRVIAQHLAATHDVTIVTTCAHDHVTWANHVPAGESADGPLRVRRFPVARERNLHRFRDISDLVFADRATLEEQEQWFRENGPDSPALLEYLERHGREFDRVLFWSYRYYTSYFGLPLVADRSVLVPTAEEDPLIHVDAVRPFFERPAGFLFLTPEEQTLVERGLIRIRPVSDTYQTRIRPPSAVIGCGLDPVDAPADLGCLDRLGLSDPFLLYLGRVDPNKGCDTLIRHFLTWTAQGRSVPLVMAGPANMPIPDHPLIRRLGFVDESLRAALLTRARALVMPSPFESLSMALLEAWNYGLPALVNARCAVLNGQVQRADGGLYYRNAAEFATALDHLLDHPETARRLGAQGLAYVDREYRWPVVMQKVEHLLAGMKTPSTNR